MSAAERVAFAKCDSIVRLAREVEPQSPAGVLLGIAIDLLAEAGASLEEVQDTVRILYADGDKLSRVLDGLRAGLDHELGPVS